MDHLSNVKTVWKPIKLQGPGLESGRRKIETLFCRRFVVWASPMFFKRQTSFAKCKSGNTGFVTNFSQTKGCNFFGEISDWKSETLTPFFWFAGLWQQNCLTYLRYFRLETCNIDPIFLVCRIATAAMFCNLCPPTWNAHLFAPVCQTFQDDSGQQKYFIQLMTVLCPTKLSLNASSSTST